MSTPAFLIKALRSIGYTIESSIADLIDNSISASAKRIDIEIDLIRERFSLLDDGYGMSMVRLEDALVLGRIDPDAVRRSNDLGRYGLGLKTASFAHCRLLKVLSKHVSGQASLQLDLDEIDPESNCVLNPSRIEQKEEEALFQKISDSGTLVIWEKFDRTANRLAEQRDQLNALTRLEKHLGMVFCRFIGSGLRITLNRREVIAWDPFMTGHPLKPWFGPRIEFPVSKGPSIECHVLPSSDAMSREEYEVNAGPNGWLLQQGIYIFRADRMITSGTWLGLGPRGGWSVDQSHLQARICVDIDCSQDEMWGLDIQKSVAQIPQVFRLWLSHYADLTREKARKFSSLPRQARARQALDLESYWARELLEEGGVLRINRGVREIVDLRDSLSDIQNDRLDRIFDKLERQVPVLDPVLKDSDQPSVSQLDEVQTEAMKSQIRKMIENLVDVKGLGLDFARSRIKIAEPFCNYPELIAEVVNERE